MGLTRQPFNSNERLVYWPQRAGTGTSQTNTEAMERRSQRRKEITNTQGHIGGRENVTQGGERRKNGIKWMEGWKRSFNHTRSKGKREKVVTQKGISKEGRTATGRVGINTRVITNMWCDVMWGKKNLREKRGGEEKLEREQSYFGKCMRERKTQEEGAKQSPSIQHCYVDLALHHHWHSSLLCRYRRNRHVH